MGLVIGAQSTIVGAAFHGCTRWVLWPYPIVSVFFSPAVQFWVGERVRILEVPMFVASLTHLDLVVVIHKYLSVKNPEALGAYTLRFSQQLQPDTNRL